MAPVPPLFRELAIVECALHVLESSLFWAPREFPSCTCRVIIVTAFEVELCFDMPILTPAGKDATAKLLGLQVKPHTFHVDNNDAVQMLAAAAAARRVSILSIGCVRNLLQGGGVGMLTEDLRDYLAAILTQRLHALPLPGLLEVGYAADCLPRMPACALLTHVIALRYLVGATLATRLTHRSFPPIIALLDPEVARLYGEYQPPLKPVPVSRAQLRCVSTSLAAKFEATMLGHATRESRLIARLGGGSIADAAVPLQPLDSDDGTNPAYYVDDDIESGESSDSSSGEDSITLARDTDNKNEDESVAPTRRRRASKAFFLPER